MQFVTSGYQNFFWVDFLQSSNFRKSVPKKVLVTALGFTLKKMGWSKVVNQVLAIRLVQ